MAFSVIFTLPFLLNYAVIATPVKPSTSSAAFENVAGHGGLKDHLSAQVQKGGDNDESSKHVPETDLDVERRTAQEHVTVNSRGVFIQQDYQRTDNAKPNGYVGESRAEAARNAVDADEFEVVHPPPDNDVTLDGNSSAGNAQRKIEAHAGRISKTKSSASLSAISGRGSSALSVAMSPITAHEIPMGEGNTPGDVGNWYKWPGLKHCFDLWVGTCIIIQFQITVPSNGSWVFTRLTMDDAELPPSRSGTGESDFSTTFGMWIGFVGSGRHCVQAWEKNGERFTSDPSEDWQTRSLNLLALPEAKVDGVNPRWTFRLNAGNIWSEWQGFEQELVFATETPTLAFYSTCTHGKNTFLATKIYVDGHEKQESRSVNGNNKFAQNSGFFVAIVPPGPHVWTVKYRTTARNNFYIEDYEEFYEINGAQKKVAGIDFMNRAMTVVQLPDADIHKVSDFAAYSTIGDLQWHPWPGLELQVGLTTDRYVIATYNVATITHNEDQNPVSMMMSRLIVNGNSMPSTRSICGKVMYCTLMGMWFGVLTAGSHTFRVDYKTPAVVSMPEGLYDWGTRALNIVVLSRVSSVLSLLQEKEGLNFTKDGKAATSSFLDLSSLREMSEVEKQVREGRVSAELMTRLKAHGAFGR